LCILTAWLFWPVSFLPLLLWGWVLWFFRDPDRSPPAGSENFTAVADGRVTDVTHLGPECILGCDAIQVGVFMSVFDVHVNRSPADGAILDVTHRDGSLLDVRRPEAWDANEATTILMRTKLGGRERKIAFRQIAGLVARRIVTDLKPGKEVSRGERIGMIRFGSRGELIVPANLVEQVEVRVGQKVRAGRTVLLRCRTEEASIEQ
jgi:phosphatidylserine decarboxylase